MTNDELKAARSQWRRRRGSLQRRDPRYKALVDASDRAEQVAREADRQAQFWGFHGPETKLDEAVRALRRAWDAQTVAWKALTEYETDLLGLYPQADLGPTGPQSEIVPPFRG